MKKIIFCDVDGTISNGSKGMNSISEKTRYAFEQLKKENYVFIASGRSKCIMDSEVLSLNPSGFITANGGYGEIDSKMIFEVLFEEETIDRIRDYCNTHNGAYMFERQEFTVCENKEDETFVNFWKSWGNMPDAFINNDDSFKSFQILMIAFNNETDCEDFYNTFSSELDLRHHNHYTSFDVNMYNINKGYGVKRILEHLGISKENAYAFGDAMNDYEMLLEVGNPIVMGNGDQRLKDLGYEVTESVEDDGVYNALVRHGLIMPFED